MNSEFKIQNSKFGALAAFCLLSSAFCPLVQSANWYVATYGSDANNGTATNAANAWLTIKFAVGNASVNAGDTIHVLGGTYTDDNITSVRSGSSWSSLVTLTNYQGQTVIIAAAAPHFIFTLVSGSYFEISASAPAAFTLTMTNRASDGAAIKISDNANHFRFRNLTIERVENGHGILLSEGSVDDGGADNEIIGCLIRYNGLIWSGSENHGIYTHTRRNVITGNEIHDNQSHGIHAHDGFPSNQTITNNWFRNQLLGVGFYTGTNNLLAGNLFTSNNIAIIENYNGGLNKVYHNTIYAGGGGIVLNSLSRGGDIFIGNLCSATTADGQGGFWTESSVAACYWTNNVSCDNIVVNWTANANSVISGNSFGNEFDADHVDTATDFRILSTSSARNMQTVALSEIGKDRFGVTRPKESTLDAGAYEFDAGGTTPVVTVVATDPSATEGGDTGTFTFTRTGSTSGALVVNYTVGGSAISGTDYTSIGTSVTIADGQSTATKTVTTIQDSLFEGVETVTVTITDDAAYDPGSPDTAQVDIPDDEVLRLVKARGVAAGGGR